MIPEVKAALDAFCAAGLMAAGQDYECGGMQLPCVVEKAVCAWFHGGERLDLVLPLPHHGQRQPLLKYGTPRQVERFVRPELAGRFFGTMCLSEPQAGSSLSDITTRAEPDPVEARGRAHTACAATRCGSRPANTSWPENIVHLVLAKIPGPDGN